MAAIAFDQPNRPFVLQLRGQVFIRRVTDPEPAAEPPYPENFRYCIPGTSICRAFAVVITSTRSSPFQLA